MIDHSISKSYAKVLFHFDAPKDYFEKRLQEFGSLLSIFNSHPTILKFFSSPLVTFAEKKTLLLKALSEKFGPLFLEFLAYVIQKRRIALIKQIANEYHLLANEYLKRWEAEIVTAIVLDEESEAKLIKKLEELFHKKIYLNKKIDPAISGGAILFISNQMLDWSVRSRLKKLEENLISTQV